MSDFSPYYANERQRQRKLDYTRYRSLTERGWSIEEETASSTLFAINTDPFGRTFFQKSLGEVVVKDPLTGRPFTQEDWATKEFIVDNKAQLVNKVSADLVVGRGLTVDFREEDRDPEAQSDLPTIGSNRVTEDLDLWLRTWVRRNKLNSLLYESAIRNSSLGDQYFSLEVVEGRIEITYVDPYFVEILKSNRGTTIGYEVAWDIKLSEEEVRTPLVTRSSRSKHLVMKKSYFPGWIRYELFELKREEMQRIPLLNWSENEELVLRAMAETNMQALMITGDGQGGLAETDATDPARVVTVLEWTGIDTPTLVHWPNYRMFSEYGVSDTGMIETLQNALNNRETQLNDVLDKHSDPAMAGDDSYLDENGNLPMSGGGGRYFPVPEGGAVPQYLEWGGHIVESHAEIQRIFQAILDNTETASALLGKDEGGIQSGRALMYKLLRSLAMAARKTVYLEQAVIDLALVAQKLRHIWIDPAAVEVVPDFVSLPAEQWDALTFEVKVEVESALPTDRKELIDEVTQQVRDGILSRETALRIIEKLYEELEAESEIEKLKVEQDEAAVRQQQAFDFEPVLDEEEAG